MDVCLQATPSMQILPQLLLHVSVLFSFIYFLPHTEIKMQHHTFFLFIHLNHWDSEKRKQPKCLAYLFLIVLYNFNQINGSGWLPHQQVFAGPLLIPLIYSLVICEIKAFEGSNQNLLIINHKKVVRFITCKCQNATCKMSLPRAHNK